MEEKKPDPITQKPQTVKECAELISFVTSDNDRWSEEQLNFFSNLQNLAKAGDPKAEIELTLQIEKLLTRFEIKIDELTSAELAYEIFKKNWGLDVIHDIYHHPDIYEVFVDRYDMISVSRLGKIEPVPGLAFEDDDHVNRVILRMLVSEDAHFDEANVAVQCVRKDDSRLTAYRPPLTEFTGFALRKLNAVVIDRDFLITAGTANLTIWNMFTLLARYGAKLLFIGPPESGKTSIVRTLISVMKQSTRILTIEQNREIRVRHHYPERSVVEMEERTRLDGGSLKQLFALSLRLSPTLVIFGEFRLGETEAAIMAGERSRHFWSTSHFRTPDEAVDGISDLLVSQGTTLSHQVAQKRVLRAFDTFVTLYGDPHTGTRKVLNIVAAEPSGEQIKYRRLAQWRGSSDDYWQGDWDFPEKPPLDFIERMRVYGVSDDELKNVGWL